MRSKSDRPLRPRYNPRPLSTHMTRIILPEPWSLVLDSCFIPQKSFSQAVRGSRQPLPRPWEERHRPLCTRSRVSRGSDRFAMHTNHRPLCTRSRVLLEGLTQAYSPSQPLVRNDSTSSLTTRLPATGPLKSLISQLVRIDFGMEDTHWSCQLAAVRAGGES